MSRPKNAAPTHRTLEDFPSYVAAKERLQDLQTGLNDVKDKISRQRSWSDRLHEEGSTERKAALLLSGSTLEEVSAEASPRFDLELLAEERNVLQVAVGMAESAVKAARSKIGPELVAEWMGEYLETIRGIRDALELLDQAHQKHFDLLETFFLNDLPRCGQIEFRALMQKERWNERLAWWRKENAEVLRIIATEEE
ncbi:MAG: hypothetical protein ABSG53_15650 [Thermoguttaceae bacterium]